MSGRFAIPAAALFAAAVTFQAGCREPIPPAPTPQPSACSYSVSPVEVTEHWHGTGFSFTVTAPAGCTWTATPPESWIKVDRAAGDGSALVAVSHDIFIEDATRHAAVQVRWPTPTGGQNVSVTQEGCRYGFDTTPASFPASGGTRRVTVVTQAVSASCPLGCPWTAASTAPWIHINSSMPRAGDDAFSYEVEANSGGARAGAITVAGRTLAVSQAGI
jgi:hypothetical protein